MGIPLVKMGAGYPQRTVNDKRPKRTLIDRDLTGLTGVSGHLLEPSQQQSPEHQEKKGLSDTQSLQAGVSITCSACLKKVTGMALQSQGGETEISQK